MNDQQRRRIPGRSDSEDSARVEAALAWRKSSYSDDKGSHCVEVATTPTTVHLRDSKHGAAGPRLTFSADAWAVFIACTTAD